MKGLSLLVKKLWPVIKVFFKVDQTSRSGSLGQKCWYLWKGLVTRNVNLKYEAPVSSGEDAKVKVKGFFLK